MRSELSAPPRDRLLSESAVSPSRALSLAERLVDDLLGPVVSCAPIDRLPGESHRLHRAASTVPATAYLSDTGYETPERTGGVGPSADRARLGAIAEAIERYCASLCHIEQFRTATARELDEPAVDPTRATPLSDAQIADRDRDPLRETTLHWTAARSLTTGDRVLVPGQCVYLPFPERSVCKPISTGLAAGTGFRSTLGRALAELLEREAFVVSYLNRLEPPALDCSTIEDRVIDATQTDLDRMGWDVTVLDVTLDHPIRTCLTVAVRETGDPVLSLGLDADPDLVAAARGSLLEAFQFARQDTLPPSSAVDTDRLATLEARAAFWTDRERLDELSFWLDPAETVPLEHTDIDQSPIAAIRSFLVDRGLDCFISDVTTSDIGDAGFRVLSAFAPELTPLYLDERYRPLGVDRLYTAPVAAGDRDTPADADDLNEVPHPFL